MHSFMKFITITFTAFILTTPASAGDAAAGKVIYNGNACAVCHGANGAGDGVAGTALDPKPTNFTLGVFRLDTDADGGTGTDADLFNTMKNGAAKYGGNAVMIGRADFSDVEINDLVAYIRSMNK